MSKEAELQIIKEPQKGYITLPFDNDQFKEFISGLLGKPQSISKQISGTFEIHREDIKNFHDLIDQRISQQNSGKLIQVSSKMLFDDGSAVELGSYAELITYNETKPVVSTAIKLTWTYLIQFADKKVPEKQEINLDIYARRFSNEYDDGYGEIREITSGLFTINIRHTARSFGTDIETLLTNHIRSICLYENPFLRRINKMSGIISAAVAFVVFAILGCGLYFFSTKFSANELENVTEFVKKSANNASAKIDYLLKYEAIDRNTHFYINCQIFLFISIIIAIASGWLVGTFCEITFDSFLVLTRQSEKRMEYLKKRRKNEVIFFIAAVIGSIVTSVVANYIFAWLQQ